MLHTYTKYNAHYDGYESYNDRCLPRIGYTKKELTLHLHTPQPTPGIAHNIYYKDNTQMSEDYFEYHGGNVLLQAILYTQKRNPQHSKRYCACQCIML